MPATLSTESAAVDLSPLSDEQVVARVRGGETALFEVLMRRHNTRAYRVARAVLKSETDAEDVMQQAYINAFTHLDQFESRAQFSTWLTRIVVREALSRRRRIDGGGLMQATTGAGEIDAISSSGPDPERQAYAGELARVLETAVDSLPEAYRTVFMLRDIEGLSTSETAAGLELGEEAVKTRLHRARAMVRRTIRERVGASTAEAFTFHADRCNRVVDAVFRAIRAKT
jgi:RNA polymerase sigma-70 factor (ECF subfamily)